MSGTLVVGKECASFSYTLTEELVRAWKKFTKVVSKCLWKFSEGTLMPSWKAVTKKPRRVAAALTITVTVGILVALGVGLVLFLSSLETLRQEFKLKCSNRQAVLMGEVTNTLNTTYMVQGMLASYPDVTQDTWLAFTNETQFLRPNTPRVSYIERVSEVERPRFEDKWNSPLLMFDEARNSVPINYTASEYGVVLFTSYDIAYARLIDIRSWPAVNRTLDSARRAGTFAMVPPDKYPGGVWRIVAYLPYYGSEVPTTPAARERSCLGWIGVSMEFSHVFGLVLSRYQDEGDMDVAVVYIPHSREDWLPSYNCGLTASECELPMYDPRSRFGEKSTATISWDYAYQTFEIRCFAAQRISLLAVRKIISWPILMFIVVLLFGVILYLAFKKMQAIEKHMYQVEKMNIDLKAAKQAAEAADHAKSRFLATVSHEIRTPMNGVIGMTNLLMGTELTAQQHEYVKIAQASGNNLVSLINEVLDLSKIEAGKMELESVPFDLRVELDDLLCLFEDKVREKKLELSAIVHDAIPCCVFGDPGRLRQVLTNLVGNSTKFTRRGSIFVCARMFKPGARTRSSATSSVTSSESSSPASEHGYAFRGQKESIPKLLRIAEDREWLSLDVDRGKGKFGDIAPRLSMQEDLLNCEELVSEWRKWVPLNEMVAGSTDDEKETLSLVISVEDTGIGVPVHLQHRLFQPFLQADSSTSREFGGTGIGLSISKKLVELMGGTLQVISAPNEGSIFEFSFQVGVENESGMKEDIKRAGEGYGEEKLEGTTVLLVDPHCVRKEVAASYLRALGVIVEDTGTIEDARGWLQENYKLRRIDAVLLDLDGVGLDQGIELVKFIRQEGSFGSLPTLALSCPLHTSAEKDKLREVGVSQTVFKPLRRTTLATGLLQAMGIALRAPTTRVNVHASLLAGKRLLVVDDNLVNRTVARSILVRYGASVECANGGVEAVEAVKSKAPHLQFDLILMDIQMPEVDGYEATRRIRRWERENCNSCGRRNSSFSDDLQRCSHSRIPIVALTADVMQGTHETCYRAGMDDFVPKPLDQKILLRLLVKVLRNRVETLE